MFSHPLCDKFSFIHPSRPGNAFQRLCLLGEKTYAHYPLGAPVKNGSLDLFEFVFKVGDVVRVPELHEFFDGIDLQNLGHSYRFER